MSKSGEFEGRWIFENPVTGRYLFATERTAGQTINYPVCVGADANYLDRAVWKIIQKDSDTYFIKNVVTGRYLYQTGDKTDPSADEGGWLNAPKTVTADDKNLYASQTGQRHEGDHGDEEGWANAPKVVGTDGNYHGLAKWKPIKQ